MLHILNTFYGKMMVRISMISIECQVPPATIRNSQKYLSTLSKSP